MTKTTTSSLSAPAFVDVARRPSLPVILRAGLLAGLCDIIAAFISYSVKTGKNPLIILNFIASGVVGKDAAYADRTVMAVLGLLLHFLIAILFAAIFYYAWPLIRKVVRNWVVAGLGYGVLVWLAMNLVVVPLSNTPPVKATTSGVITGMLILMLCIGLPVAWIIARKRS